MTNFAVSPRPSASRRILVLLTSLALLFGTVPQAGWASQDSQAPPQPAGPTYAQQTPDELQRLVAPIALYPDSLVAQILTASTFPEQVVEADRWLQNNQNLKGDALAQAVDQQPWDPSVKALTAFPSVLGNMDKNISWTSSLGDAYYNQQEDVMNAVQVMRQKAKDAGNLKPTPQQNVTVDDYGDINIAPVSPEVVYVPAYDPWLIYGYSILPWPGWYEYPGIWYGGPYLYFGIGFGIGWFGGFGWGWGYWGCDWRHHYPIFHRSRYYSGSRTFYNRDYYYRRGALPRGVRPSAPRPSAPRPPAGAPPRGQVFNRPGGTARPFEGNQPAARGYAPPRGQSGTRSGAFSNYDHGGESRSYSSRGSASMGGGARGGGGGGHAGGGGARSGGRR